MQHPGPQDPDGAIGVLVAHARRLQTAVKDVLESWNAAERSTAAGELDNTKWWNTWFTAYEAYGGTRRAAVDALDPEQHCAYQALIRDRMECIDAVEAAVLS